MTARFPVERETAGRETVLFREGDSAAGDRAYFIESGTVRLLRGAPEDPNAQVITQLGAGDVFGEMALVDPAPRTATAVCETDCTLLTVESGYLDAVMGRADPILPYMLSTLTARLRKTMNGDSSGGDTHAPEPRSSETREAVQQRLARIRDLDAVLAEDRLVPLFQPIVSVATGRTAGFEALLRVREHDGALRPPMGYVELAEDLGRTRAIARRMLHHACREAVRWGPDGPYVAVNISQRDLEDCAVLDDVREALADTGLAPHRLELEVTESALSADIDTARACLDRLRAMARGAAIDDFGTGYASMQALASLPVSKLKIDKSFVWRYGEDSTATTMVEAMITLAQRLGIHTTAEGVETEAHLRGLRDLGCDYAQGFLFAKPLDRDAAAAAVDTVWFRDP